MNLSEGERWMLGEKLSRFIQAREESADSPRTRHAERGLARLLGRFYRGRVFTMAGFAFTVDDMTPAGSVRIRDAEEIG